MQLSFQMWTNQMQDTLNSKKKGDAAFRHKDFKAAIECYSQVRPRALPLLNTMPRRVIIYSRLEKEN